MKIPKLIFQTWVKKIVSEEFQKIINTWKDNNKDYKYSLYDNSECDEFIKNNFPNDVYVAYNKIIPGAYKADLWRYCILYKYGGIYADIDTLCIGKIDDFLDEDIEYAVSIDFNTNAKEGKHNLFNTFIAIIPNSEIMLNCIKRIVYYTQNGIIPESLLDFSGPGLLGRSTNLYLNFPEDASFIGKEGKNNNIHFLKFEKNTEYVKDLDGNILFQNKNGNKNIISIYQKECYNNKVISWLTSKAF
jgi:hypothetical protein